MEKNNATCSICGKGYYMCLSCKSLANLHPWQIHTDTSEHYKIYQIIHGYSTGVYTKDEAKDRLQMVDLSDLDNLRDNIKDAIKDIMGIDKEEENVKVENLSDKSNVTENGTKGFAVSNKQKKH